MCQRCEAILEQLRAEIRELREQSCKHGTGCLECQGDRIVHDTELPEEDQ